MLLYNEDIKNAFSLPGFQDAFDAADDVECYEGDSYHTDHITNYKTWSELMDTKNARIGNWQLMDADEYNSTVCANSADSFADTYFPDDKVLVVLYFIADDDND